jgi:hypothetical protein
MKIIKKIPEKYSYISNVFDGIIRKNNYNLKTDRLVICISDENDLEFGESEVLLKLNSKDIFVSGGDERGIGILITIQFYRFLVRSKVQTKIKFIEDLTVAREMIKNGMGEDVMYFYYNRLAASDKKLKNIEDFMAASLPELAFRDLDIQYSELLGDLLPSFKYKKEFALRTRRLFELMEKDLSIDINVKNAEREYRKLVKCR